MNLHQREDFTWEMREPTGALRALISWDSALSLYYVSFGDMNAEVFCSFSDACRHAEGGGA